VQLSNKSSTIKVTAIKHRQAVIASKRNPPHRVSATANQELSTRHTT